jgi:hypothetical protein
MKVNLITDQEHAKEGYDNIPLNQEAVERIPDSACKEIMVDNVLEFIPEQTATILLKKMRKGGVLEIRSPDAQEIFRQFHIGSLGFEDASSLLTGGRARMSTLNQTRSFLESNGFEIAFAGLNGPFYRITAKRP